MVWAVFVPHEAFKFISLRTQRDASALKSGKWTCPIKTTPNQTKKTRKHKQRRAQLLAEVAQLKKECAEQSKKTDKKFEEVGKKIEEISEQIEKVSKENKEVGKEVKEFVEGLRQVRIASENHGDRIGQFGNNLGSYTEAMAMRSISGILDRHFDADFKGSYLVRNTGNHQLNMEVDAWAPAATAPVRPTLWRSSASFAKNTSSRSGSW